MQNELRSEYPDMSIQIVGINEVGFESGNPLMSEGRSAPVLQDVDADNNGSSDVWYDLLDITYRDVQILNKENELVGTVNLTPPGGYDLGEEINYDALKQIFTDVAHERPLWQNPDDPLDVNDDERVSAVDALQCINELILGNVSGSDPNLPLPMPPATPKPYLDVNGDGLITAVDALRVINRLIEQSSAAEGELISEAALAAPGPGPLETAARSTVQSATEETRDAGDEPSKDALLLVGTSADPLGSTHNTSAQRGLPLDADSSTLSRNAVDSVFQSDDDTLVGDAISASLIDD